MYPQRKIWIPVVTMVVLVATALFATSSVTVRSGDTLSEIAARHGVRTAQLVAWNDLSDPDRIIEGHTLLVAAPSKGKSTPAPQASGRVHVVTAGDTLSGIAARLGTTIAKLVVENRIDDADRIIIGQRLSLPGQGAQPEASAAADPPTPAEQKRHTIAPGDTLHAIARHYGVSTAALAKANGIRNPDLIVTGKVLTIPGAVPKAPKTKKPTTTAAPTPTPTAAPTPTSSPTSPTEQAALISVFVKWTEAYDVPRDVLEAIAWKETRWAPRAVGENGHLGITQLSPQTVTFIGQSLIGRDLDPLDPEDGIQMAARYLRYLTDRTADSREAVAAWVQGVSSVQRDGVTSGGAAYADAVEEIRRQRG